MDSNEILKELINKQLKNISPDKKLLYTDLIRICKYITSSILDDEKCSIWGGYITNSNNGKGIYINFYFRKKKIALHRLLYSNYVEDLGADEYLKFSCDNKGNCCNVKHLVKFSYNKKEQIDTCDKDDNDESEPEPETSSDILEVSFD